MINFEKFTLENGLRVIVHKDDTTPIVAMNILYDVGARDEKPNRTGFAHLFEHLMFGGSKNIPSYDEPLQRVGGENNAFTSNDITNYYLTLPKENIETAFWLESDRMLSLAFTEKSLDVQRNVVIEEFKQRYLNQPYGDMWLLIRPLAYKKHPYQWATIGVDITHIATVRMRNVKSFFYKHYVPNNAIMVVAGNVEVNTIRKLAEKWFAPIEPGGVPARKLPVEPVQKIERKLTVKKDVPYDCIMKAYHMPDRLNKDYYTVDIISDLLSGGKSSRLFTSLVQEKKLFSEIEAFVTGSIDNGLFIITGNLMDGVKMKTAEKAIQDEINKLIKDGVTDYELDKVKNKVESILIMQETNVLNKAMNLAYYELLGDAGLINVEIDRYRAISAVQIRKVAKKILRSSNCSTLYYLSDKK